MGWACFAALVRGTPIPIYALGGLDHSDLDVALSNGAHGVALRRAAWSGRSFSAFV
jgi:8-oxo-dGTP diphosphatase